MPIVSAPATFAISATTGAPPVPVPPPSPSGDEHHVGALQHLLDLVAVVLGGLAADLGIGAGAETPRELAADVELHVGVAHQQRLRVGVHRDELDALQAGVDHPVDGVAAAAADADDLDHREVVLRLAQHVSFSRLLCGARLRRRLSLVPQGALPQLSPSSRG